MPISTKNIHDNWEMLTNGYEYYEQELFTKFEDAFLYECNGRPDGLKIIHHARSYVNCPDFKTVLKCTSGVKMPRCELADLRFLMYSLRKGKARLLFLQFKNGEENTKGNYAEINEKQMLLFSNFPAVSFVGKGFGPHDVLQDRIHGRPQSGAMFCIIEYDLIMKKHNLRFMNHTMLDLPGPYLTKSPSGNHYYDICPNTIQSTVPATVSRPAFTYCDYVPSFSDFLDNVKKLEIGREIDMTGILAHVPEESLPEDLKKYYRDIGKDMINDNVKYNESNNSNKTIYQVDTIALNVDELV